MNSRERVCASLNHKQPDKVAVDFGGTNDSTMHVSCIEGLREYYGLDRHPVTCWDVFTMAGIIEPDLAEALGADTAPSYTTGSVFGFSREKLKEWKNLQGQTILVPESFNPQADGRGGYYVHPQGDTSVPASGHMPAKSFYFDAILRQEPIDEEKLDPQDNLEEWTALSEKDLAYIKKAGRRRSCSREGGNFRGPRNGLGGCG